MNDEHRLPQRTCKCDDCREIRNAKARARRAGHVPEHLVPTTEVLEVIRVLRDAGYTWTKLEKSLGVTRSSMQDYMAGRVTKCKRTTADQIIARGWPLASEAARLGKGSTDLPELPSLLRYDSAVYREQLRRLGAAGWSRARIERMAGILPRTGPVVPILNIWRKRSKYISATTASALDKAFEEIGDRMGPDVHVATYWRDRGWLPPVAYDDDGLPNPRFVPALTRKQVRAVMERRREMDVQNRTA